MLKPAHVHLSREAIAYHKQVASSHGFIRGTISAMHISDWFMHLAYCEFMDTRPDYAQDTAYWTPGDSRVQVTVRISDEARRLYAKIAALHNIPTLGHQRTLFLGRTPDPLQPGSRPMAYTSAVLEAIGTRWLSPIELPWAPATLHRQAPRYRPAWRSRPRG